MLFTKKFSQELFNKPTSEFRGTPFWAWNTKLEKDELLWQIEQLKEMGLGGFHIHCRSGMSTEYLSDEFMELVKACADKAEQENMLCWLYDEDRWPSGAAGGIVTKDESFRARYLLFTPVSKEQWSSPIGAKNDGDSSAQAIRNNKGTFLGRYEVILDKGILQSYRLLGKDETISDQASDQAAEWFAYLEIVETSPWYNNQTYVNTLDKRAIERFIEVTHERYKGAVGEKFGGVIPAIFTDEPQFTHKKTLGRAEDMTDLIIPYTDDFEVGFSEQYGESFLAKLPEIFWNMADDIHSLHRYRYHDFVSELFASSFADTIGNWCKDNKLMLTGHMMEEPTLQSQSAAIGDCMRSYRSFQLPGIDMLCNWREYSTAKQAQSAVHQYGYPGVLSELYGVTNWDFDFRGHKLQGDWQAALGVNVRVHHLSWVSMKGDAKRDYPASINYQSPWYKEYNYIEDHFARVNTAMTQGKPKVNIGVIHPIESYWLQMGPDEQSGIVKQEMQYNFEHTIDWLLHEHLDFDFIAESLLPDQAHYSPNAVPAVGEMQYQAILVPDCRTLRKTTLEFLRKSAEAGCKIIFSGTIPNMIDTVKDASAAAFAGSVKTISHSRVSLKQALEFTRCISIKRENGMESDRHIYQFREDGNQAYLFIAPSKAAEKPDTAQSQKLQIIIAGLWTPKYLDTLSGRILECKFDHLDGNTILNYEVFEHDSLLFQLGTEVSESHQTKTANSSDCCMQAEHAIEIPSEVPITLSENNVMLLDMAEYSLDGEERQPAEELLRIHSALRKRLGWPNASKYVCQPWAMPEYTGQRHSVSLRFSIQSEIELSELEIALENPEATRVVWNNIAIQSETSGWFTDKSIKKLPLPVLKKGINTLELQFPYIPVSTIEWCYLLGNFGVSAIGTQIKITAPPEKLIFGDWSTQGLPFYAGNVDYILTLELAAGTYVLETPQYRNPLLSLIVDGKDVGKIVFAPYQIQFKIDNPGTHTLCLRAFGNRVNAFGAVHNCDPNYKWFGPSAWVTKGREWSYEYQLKKMGVLITPRLYNLCPAALPGTATNCESEKIY